VKKIVILTESDLIRIVKKVLKEETTSKVITKPTRLNVKVFNNINYKDAEKLINKYKNDGYHLPKYWENIKDTFTTGEYWTGLHSGTYNVEYYDFKDKQKYRGNSLHKKNLILIKNPSS